MKKYIGIIVMFVMLVLGSIETDAMTMDIEDARHIFFKEFRQDFREIKKEYGDWELHNTDEGFVMEFLDEEESEYMMIEYNFEECTCTAWDWDFGKEVEEFNWSEMIVEKIYEEL